MSRKKLNLKSRNFKIGKVLSSLFLFSGLIAGTLLVNSKYGFFDIREKAYSESADSYTVIKWDFDKNEGFKAARLSSQKVDAVKIMTLKNTGAYIINNGLSKVVKNENVTGTKLNIRMAVETFEKIVPPAPNDGTVVKPITYPLIKRFNFAAKFGYSISGRSYSKTVSIDGLTDGHFVEYSVVIPWWENNQNKNRVLNSFKLSFGNLPAGSKISIDYIEIVNTVSPSESWIEIPCNYTINPPKTCPEGYACHQSSKLMGADGICVKTTPVKPSDKPIITPTPGICNNYWFYDNTNRTCSQKEFCGKYMYIGLMTFTNEKDCLISLSGQTPLPVIQEARLYCNYTINPPNVCPEGYTCIPESELAGAGGYCVKNP